VFVAGDGPPDHFCLDRSFAVRSPPRAFQVVPWSVERNRMLARVIDGFGIVRGDQHRGGPLEATLRFLAPLPDYYKGKC